MRRIPLLFLIFLVIPQVLFAQNRSAFSSAGGSGTSSSYSLQYTVGETFPGGVATSDNYQLIVGFYRPDNGCEFLLPSVNPAALTTPLPNGQSVSVEADVIDTGSGLNTATLFHRKGGDPTFVETPMSLVSGDTYTATVPSESVTNRGGEYFVRAIDNCGNTFNTTPLPLMVLIEAPGLQAPLRQGQLQSDYRLISAPLNLSNKSSSNVLSDLGSYDDTRWRFWDLKNNYFDFEGDAQFTELRSGASFDPGAAYFLLSAEGGMIQTGAAVTISTVTPATKLLHPGWNFIGNPFNFNIPTSAISLSNGLTPNVQSFANGWSVQSTLQPFQGYIIDAGLDDNNVTVSINPDLSAGKSPGKIQDSAFQQSELSWSIQVDARSGDYFDTQNFIGVSADASSAWDQLDRPEPPVLGDFVSVYFPHEDWGVIHKRFETDIRPEPSGGDVWDFEVSTGSRMPVAVTFSGLESVPQQYDVKLVDQQAGIVQDLRKNLTYTVITAGANKAWPLQLVIGESDYIDDQVEMPDLVPVKFELDQNYPNPFNPTTSIRYGIADEATVSLKIYNLLGKVVATLVDQEYKSAGFHLVHWDAHADDGSEVASGLYVYQLHVSSGATSGVSNSNRILSRKMLLVK